MFTKEQLDKIRSLLQAYEIACDNRLYKYADYSEDSRDCMEMIDILDEEIRKLNA